MRTCTCGAAHPDDAVYCDKCGRRLEETPWGTPWLHKFCPHCSRAYPRAALFCDVCGRPLSPFPERKRKMSLSDPRGREITVEGQSREFGRADFAAWVESGQAQRISRTQFRITVAGPDFLLEHLSTSSPTILNGRAVTRSQRLEHGDVIDVAQGSLRLLVTIR